MKCPFCSFEESKVIDSRPTDEGERIRRRRECMSCAKRFTTYEVIDTVPIAVVKRNGEREFFDKHKLTLGIERACQKRPVDAAQIASTIEAELQNSIITEITSKQIGELVLAHLRDVDIVSYIRFASVYREFQDVESFMAEIKNLFCLCEVKRSTVWMVALAVAHRYQKLTVNSLYKIKHANPLFFCEDTCISFGSLATCFIFKVIICFGCPRA